METFLVENTKYITLIVVLIIWLGLSAYLFAIDRKLRRLERLVDNLQNSKAENQITGGE